MQVQNNEYSVSSFVLPEHGKTNPKSLIVSGVIIIQKACDAEEELKTTPDATVVLLTAELSLKR